MHLHQNRLVLFVVVTLALAVPAFANRGVTAEDYFAFHFPSDAHISPDGKQVAYVVTVIDQQRNRRVSSGKHLHRFARAIIERMKQIRGVIAICRERVRSEARAAALYRGKKCSDCFLAQPRALHDVLLERDGVELA